MYATMLNISIGFITLTTGRQLCWLYAGGVAFVSTLIVAPMYINLPVGDNLFILSLGIGVIVGLLAALLGRVATTLALFLVGGYLLISLPEILGWDPRDVPLTYIIVAGLAAVLLAFTWFDVSLILLSSLTGANLIIQTINLSKFNTLVAYFGMVIFGIITQLILMQYWPASEED
jgi:hypothetical protein